MILLAFAFLAFGITDLLCWSPEGVSRGRLGVALWRLAWGEPAWPV